MTQPITRRLRRSETPQHPGRILSCLRLALHVDHQQAAAARFRRDIQTLLRARVLEAIEITLEEELAEASGCCRYERSGDRRGYRYGSQRRTITTAYGPKDLEIPRGRVVGWARLERGVS
jgi:hypothetical protein